MSALDFLWKFVGPAGSQFMLASEASVLETLANSTHTGELPGRFASAVLYRRLIFPDRILVELVSGSELDAIKNRARQGRALANRGLLLGPSVPLRM